jgi:hypothetical protein
LGDGCGLCDDLSSLRSLLLLLSGSDQDPVASDSQKAYHNEPNQANGSNQENAISAPFLLYRFLLQLCSK